MARPMEQRLLTEANANVTYLHRGVALVSLDEDGTPFFDDSTPFENAVPILVDTDGTPYLGN